MSEQKKLKLLYAVIDKYEKDGKSKNKYLKIGVEITEPDDKGGENSYFLLDRHINLAGMPDFSKNKKGRCVLVSKFNVTGKEAEAAEFEGDAIF